MLVLVEQMEEQMNLRKLKDDELLASIQSEVQKERQTLIVILQHLREIEVRKLFSELGYPSLFDFAVSELKYSRGEAGRKIQAMRLLIAPDSIFSST